MSRDLRAAARAIVAFEIRVVPLLPKSKRPRFEDWQNRPLLTRGSVDTHWQAHPHDNVGVLGGQGIAIVDIDGDQGRLEFARMQLEHGMLPPTPTVISGGDGEHRWFRTEGDVTSWNPAPGVEVRARGRQTVAPPSRHPGGGIYRWQDYAVPPPLPAWLIKPEPPPRTAASQFSGLSDPVLEIAPTVYVAALTGREPDTAGFIVCPLHGDTDPSLKAYKTAEKGWYCFGCQRGGSIVDLAAELAGIPAPVRGAEFIAILDYLRGRFA